MKLLSLALAMTTLMSVDQVFAISHFDRKNSSGVRIYDLLLKQDVPEKALRRVFEFLDINAGKTVVLKDRDRARGHIVLEKQPMTIHDDYASIIDYSKPSNQPRLYLMNLSTGNVEKYLVAHGRNSGAVVPAAFSNLDESKQSSLGLYVGGDIYRGHHGRSLRLHGLEASNSNAMFRDIVIHSANYVSYNFIRQHGRLGRSWGCPAVSPRNIRRVLSTMQNGSIIYGYHKDLMTSTLKNPSLQILPSPVVDDGDDQDLPGEEEDLAKKSAPATSGTKSPVAAPKGGPSTPAKADAAVITPPKSETKNLVTPLKEQKQAPGQNPPVAKSAPKKKRQSAPPKKTEDSWMWNRLFGSN